MSSQQVQTTRHPAQLTPICLLRKQLRVLRNHRPGTGGRGGFSSETSGYLMGGRWAVQAADDDVGDEFDVTVGVQGSVGAVESVR
jgi:hypothetical protein